ncbi:hypothetical protein D3C81_1142620 [compost metagenome]
MKLAHFSSAFFLVSSPIHGSVSRRAFSATDRFCTRCSIATLDSAGNTASTYSWPSASPIEPFTESSTRFQRGCISCWPRSVLLKKSKLACSKFLLRYGAALSTVWKRR